jgi:hypothetical protein
MPAQEEPVAGTEGGKRGVREKDLNAVDGYYHQTPCFDKKHENSKGEFRAIVTGHFFRMNMRTHHLSCLGMANPEDGK